MTILVATLAGLVLLAAGFGVGRWMLPSSNPSSSNPSSSDPSSSDPSSNEPPSNDQAVSEESVEPFFELNASPEDVLSALAAEEPAVERLYERTGFSPQVKARVQRLLEELRARVQVDIPDYDAFLDALDEARTQMDLMDTTKHADTKKPEALREAEAFLHDVWSLRNTPGAVVERLETHPVDEQLPFIEQMPVTREGTIHWRTPARVTVLHKQATDVQSVRRLLDRFRAMINNAPLPRSEDATDDVRAILGRIRRDLDAEAVYLPALLQRLEDAVSTWLNEPPTPEALTKKEELDALLLNVCRLERVRPYLADGAATDSVPPSVRPHVVKRYRSQSINQAQTYVDATWMHVHWLTDTLLAHLLTAEGASGDDPDSRIATIAREAYTQSYDPQESMRRLRAYEDDAGFVHSLAFALLRLRRASS